MASQGPRSLVIRASKSFRVITLGSDSRQMIFNLQDASSFPPPFPAYLCEIHIEGVSGVGAALA